MRLRVRFGSHRLEWTPTLGRGRCRRGPSGGSARKLAVTSPRLAPGPVRTAWVKPTQRRLARYAAEEYCSLRFFAMLASFTFWLVILAVLIAYLCVSVRLRHRVVERAEEARLRALERQFPGRAFDTSAIAPQIRHVRQDYAASAHERSRPAFYRAGLLAAARRIVTSLSYFRRTRHEHELHKHDG